MSRLTSEPARPLPFGGFQDHHFEVKDVGGPNFATSSAWVIMNTSRSAASIQYSSDSQLAVKRSISSRRGDESAGQWRRRLGLELPSRSGDESTAVRSWASSSFSSCNGAE